MPEDTALLADLAAAGPLADRSAVFGEAVALAARPVLGRLNLRAAAGSAPMATALRELDDDATWPPAANCWTALGPQRQLVWLGPDEALLLAGDAGIATVEVQLRAVLGSASAAVTDVSDAAACIRLNGPRSTEVLAKGCPLDLGNLPDGAAVQTLLAQLDILLLVLEQGQVYDIHVRSSLAAFAWDWLADAAAEYL